jgi:hypothetical protein
VSTHLSMDPQRTQHRIGGTTLILIILLLSLASIGPISSMSAETPSVPDSIDLSRYDQTAGPVTFIHKDHGSTGKTKPACSDCHHTTAWDQVPEKCSTCHTPLGDTTSPTDAVAFHKLCVGCHKTEITNGNMRLTLACDSCHAVNGVK